jgi:hypothetical protein|tara:strand:+ start:2392 stop:2682 length:291 start_codon:yes stop_codon:yes gene_type:complete
MENFDENGDENMIVFFKNLVISIEEKKLLPQQLQRIGEFFMSYKFQEQAIADGNILENIDDVELNEADFMKFLILGWYIYVCILKDKSLPQIDNKV